MISEGIRSGVNWMRLKLRPSVSLAALTISVLPEAGDAFDQNMAAAKQRGQQFSHDLAMADDYARDFALGARKSFAKIRDPLVG